VPCRSPKASMASSPKLLCARLRIHAQTPSSADSLQTVATSSPPSATVASVSGGGDTGAAVRTQRTVGNLLRDAILAPDNSTMLALMQDDRVRLLQRDQTHIDATLPGRYKSEFAFSPDGARLFYAADDMKLRIVDMRQLRVLATLPSEDRTHDPFPMLDRVCL
jgi:hypothetical protein